MRFAHHFILHTQRMSEIIKESGRHTNKSDNAIQQHSQFKVAIAIKQK
jgi:hypothetical protein